MEVVQGNFVTPAVICSEDPLFGLNFSKVDGKLNECSKDNQEAHPGQKIAYCQVHQVLFCAVCMVTEHSNCLGRVTVQPILFEELKELSKRIDSKVSKHQDDLLNINHKLETLEEAVENNKKRTIMFGDFVVGTIKQLVNDFQSKQEEAHDDLNDKIGSLKREIENGLSNCSKVRDNCAQVATKPKESIEFIELIEQYDALKTDYENNKENDFAYLKAKLKSLEDISKSIMLNVDENLIKSQLEVNFKKLIGIGLRVESEQTNSENLYVLNPLATYLRLFDPQSRTITICDLILDGKPFNVPCGAASSIYSNRIVISGGTLNFNSCLKDCYEYSSLFGNVKRCKDLAVARYDHAMLRVDEYMYALGGKGDEDYFSSCEYCKLTGKDSFIWKEIAPLSEAKSHITACVCGDYIYIFGGLGLKQKSDALAVEQPSEKFDSPIVLSTIERLNTKNIATSLWEIVGDVVNLSGKSFCIVYQSYKNNKGFYIFGGIDNEDTFIPKTYFLEFEESKKPLSMKATLIENCIIDDPEGLSNCTPIIQKGTNRIWVASKSHFYFLDTSDCNSLDWKRIEFTITI